MKTQLLNIGLFVFVMATLLLIACNKKTDNEMEWGSAVVYMPQAAILNGGTTNNYPVPLNNNPSTRNYTVDSFANTIQVVLGVKRSGLQSMKSFTVKVQADIDTTNKIIAGGSIEKAVLLPEDIYTLPAELTVADDSREAIFFLTIDRKKLIEKYTMYKDKKLVLTVGINLSSKEDDITLNEALRRTVIILDAASFM